MAYKDRKHKMAKEKLCRELETFSSLCIDSFILNCYIRDSTRRAPAKVDRVYESRGSRTVL